MTEASSSIQAGPRLAREARTVTAMVRIYCCGHHGTRDELCTECEALSRYALERLRRCPFQEGKTTCAKCPVHCYRPDMRSHIRAVMRYAGPRMLTRHPLLTLYHLLDGRRDEPVRLPQEKGVRPL
jgi:hypothetical protein